MTDHIKLDIFKPGHLWTNKEIEKLFDSRPNLTLEQLSLFTGKSIEDLKKLLMGE